MNQVSFSFLKLRINLNNNNNKFNSYVLLKYHQTMYYPRLYNNLINMYQYAYSKLIWISTAYALAYYNTTR